MQGGRRPSCWKREVGGPLAYDPLCIAQIFVLSLGLHLVSILVQAIVGDISRGHSCLASSPVGPRRVPQAAAGEPPRQSRLPEGLRIAFSAVIERGGRWSGPGGIGADGQRALCDQKNCRGAAQTEAIARQRLTDAGEQPGDHCGRCAWPNARPWCRACLWQSNRWQSCWWR